MSTRVLLWMTAVLVLLAARPALAGELKIGAVNLEAVLAYLPATQAMNNQMQTYQAQLAKGLQARQDTLRQRTQEAAEKAQQLEAQGKRNDPSMEPLIAEIRKLDREVQQAAQDADQKLALERDELLQPIVASVEEAIGAVAEKGGYTHVFNTVDSGGVSLVLHMPPGDDLTRQVLVQLGAKLPPE